MPLVAGGVKLLRDLKDPLTGISAKRRGSLESELGRLTGRARAGQIATGRPQGEFIGQELGRAGDLGSRRIDDALLGILGEGSLRDFRSEQDFQRNAALAEEIGAALAPSLLQQITSGLGGLGQAGLQGAGLFQALRRRPRTSGRFSFASDDLGEVV
ncbi:MAG: hypothetical protein MN733_29940 [Nitrososphaera sp.]|nr:hypothetical protein [Nitrososphaera sp.]